MIRAIAAWSSAGLGVAVLFVGHRLSAGLLFIAWLALLGGHKPRRNP